MRAIEVGCGERLENLSFSTLHIGAATVVKSMNAFRVLKQLELNIEVLPNRFTCPGTSQLTPPLGDILPPSVERFCLAIHFGIQARAYDLKNMYSEISAGDNSKLPNLKEIVIRTWALEEYEFSCPWEELYDILQHAIGLPITDLGLIPDGSTEETERSRFFLCRDSEPERTLGSLSAEASVPCLPTPKSNVANMVKVSVVRLEKFMASFMTGWCERYGVSRSKY
ncbi:hypothetical protein DL98DRAFT_43680 [Cadophora sp. DSE1049]|nr:hypothetical protein DL98DRAFT_43680 [Cadophora sp. DSE1049]